MKLVLYGFCLVLFACSSLSTNKSDIPDKREYPVDTNINPCVDFYSYACNEVIDSYELRSDRPAHTFSFSDSAERILEFKKNYFQKLGNIEPENQKEKMYKNFYLACMDEPSRLEGEKKYISATKDLVLAIKSKKQFFEFMSKNLTTGHFAFLSFQKLASPERPDYNDFLLTSDFTKLPDRTYYDNKELITEYIAIKEMFFETIGVKRAKEIAKKLLDFEIKVSKKTPTTEEIRKLFVQKKYNSRTQLKKELPNFYVENILRQLPKKIKSRDLLFDSIKEAHTYISKMSLEDLKHLYLYYELSDVMDIAYPEYFKKRFDFNHKYLGGAKERSELQERCTKLTMNYFSMEIDFVLIDRFFPNLPEKEITSMAEKIRMSIINSVQENKWLSKSGKKSALKKMKTARLQLVKPQKIDDWGFNLVTEYDSKNYIQNKLNYDLLSFKKDLEEISKKINKDRWSMHPLQVNAYYSPSANKFVLPAAILQYPFYDASMPEELNLAGIGTVIGHELGHGIDDKGSKYDYTGKLNNWLTKEDLKRFELITKPFIEQFNQAGHNGVMTLGENIGDLVGLTASYKAAFPKGEKAYTKEIQQKFFLQYARVWCEKQRESFKTKRLKTDPHSLGIARVNEQVKHHKEFEYAYSCKMNDPMVIDNNKRIRVW